MIIDNNETEKKSYERISSGQSKKKALKSRKNLPLLFAQSMPIRITAPAQKHADITATARNALPYTGRTRSMCQTVCARSLIKKIAVLSELTEHTYADQLRTE